MPELSHPHPPSPPRRRGWLRVLGVLALVLAVGLAARWLAGQRTWTDERDIRVTEREALRRQVLWSKAARLPETLNSKAHEYEPAMSPDGTELYFVRGKPGEGADICVAVRRNNAWSAPRPLPGVNSPADELGPRLANDGNLLLFYSNRPGGLGQYDLWAARRQGDGWGTPFNLGPAVNSPFNDYSPAMTPDGRRLLFASNRKAAARRGAVESWRATIREADLGDYDLFAADVLANAASTQPATQKYTQPPSTGPATAPRATPAITFSPAVELQGVNTPYHEGACDVAPDGNFLYFASNRPGGRGKFDLYRGRLRADEVTQIENLGAPLNTPDNETDPQLAAGGFRIYFSSDATTPAGGGYDLFTAEAREVWPQRMARSLPTVGWAWWLLLASLLLLFVLARFYRSVDPRKLTILQRCVLASLLIHLLLTLIFGVVGVTHQIVQLIRERGGMELAVNLDVSREVTVGEAVRQQLTDLPLPPAPSSSAARVEEAAPILEMPPAPVVQNVPRARLSPTAMTIDAQAPPITPPLSPDRLAVAPTFPPAPAAPDVNVRMETSRPGPSAEQSIDAPAPEVHVSRSTEAPAPVEPPTPVRVEAVPVPANSVSAATAAATPPRVDPLPSTVATFVPQVRPPEAAPAPQFTLPTIQRPRSASTQPARPEVAENRGEVPRQTTPAPTTRPAAVATNVPAARPDAFSTAPPTHPPPGPAVAITLPAPPRDAAVPAPPAIRATPEISLPPVARPGAAVHSEMRPTPAPAALAPGIEPQKTSPAPRQAADAVKIRGPESVAALSPEALPLPVVPPAILRPSIPMVQPGSISSVSLPKPLLSSLEPGRLASPDSLLPRSFEQRMPLVEKLGGSKESEDAVTRALLYLSRNQERDGRWTRYNTTRAERSRERERDKHDAALTGLAVLCFLAADHTPARDGPYRDLVTRGIEYLLSIQKDDGDVRGGGDMYDQGIAAIALAEAAIMTRDPRLRAAAFKACDFIVKAQHPDHGGWRYQPRSDGDTSVLGWQVMALHGAEMLGYEIPQTTRRGAIRWLDRVSTGKHRVLTGYTSPQPRQSMTSEGLFARILLKQELADAAIAEASRYLIDQPPNARKPDHYTWYYTSLALMQLQNDAWVRWNGQLRDLLVKTQRRTGDLAGSWDMDDHYGQRAGRVYSTTMATLTLEVYYRYLPMYARAAPARPQANESRK